MFKQPSVFEYVLYDLENFAQKSFREKLMTAYSFRQETKFDSDFNRVLELEEYTDSFERFLQQCNKITPIR